MGLLSVGTPKADTFRSRDVLVTALSYIAGTAGAMTFVAVLVALVTLGWQDFARVLAVPQGAGHALAISALVLAIALPVTFAIGLCAAVTAIDPSIGGVATRAVRESLEWSVGIPPVVIGAAVFFTVVAFVHSAVVGSAAIALIVLNLPNATARLAQAFSGVPDVAREAAAALGASSVSAFFGLTLPRSAWAVAAVLCALAAQMVGETSAVALAVSASGGAQPLSAAIWHFASNVSLAATEAASCLVLVLVVTVCTALSKDFSRRQIETSATTT